MKLEIIKIILMPVDNGGFLVGIDFQLKSIPESTPPVGIGILGLAQGHNSCNSIQNKRIYAPDTAHVGMVIQEMVNSIIIESEKL